MSTPGNLAEDRQTRAQSDCAWPALYSIRKSVTPDYLICLRWQEAENAEAAFADDVRHVAAGLPEKWGLPADYPMVAPNYAARRSEFATQIGLGRKSAAEQPKRKRAKT